MIIKAFIPFSSSYRDDKSSLEQRAKIILGGFSLLERTLITLSKVNKIQGSYVFTSDSDLKDSISKSTDFNLLHRDKYLDKPDTTIELIIESFIEKVDVDIIVMINPRKPFLKPETINECIDKVSKGKFDSAFIASKKRKLSWFQGKPLNFDIKKDTPHLKSLDPVLFEDSTLYVFQKVNFIKSRKRIGKNPFIKELGHFENFEVDKEDDRKIAELIVNSGLDKEIT
jgi:CMP-N-acetylneuraminic acid synthetase|tara:strand:+ start:1594 stop:2274 length:681 start_codon:yes stop_codon:yes gene_type:complete